MLIAQITDSHVGISERLVLGRVDPRAALLRVLETIAALTPRPDFILHTGDITHHGDLPLNKEVRAMLEATGIRHCVIPGNHDEIDVLREAYADANWMPKSSRFLHWVVDDLPVRIIGLDSTIPNEIEGMLCDERLQWLSTHLAAGPARPTVIAMHHPPFRTGRPATDARPFGNAAAFRTLLENHPNVALVLAGHVHCPLQTRIGHAVAITASSTAFQFAMDRRPDGVIALSGEPAGYYVHDWKDGFGFTSHYAPVGDFGQLLPLDD